MKTRSASQPTLKPRVTIDPSLDPFFKPKLSPRPTPSRSENRKVHPEPPVTPVSTLMNSKLFLAPKVSSDTHISAKHQLIDELITYLQLHHPKSLDKCFMPCETKYKSQEEQLDYWQKAALTVKKNNTPKCTFFPCASKVVLNPDLDPFYSLMSEEKLNIESLKQQIKANYPGLKPKFTGIEQKSDKPLATGPSNQ